MIGLMAFPGLFALAALWLTRGGRVPRQRWLSHFALITLPTPFLASAAGWVFTEMGRQPWIVYGVLPTYSANSPSVSSGQVLFTMVGFTLIYGVIAVVVLKLFTTYIAKGLPAVTAPDQLEANEPLHFAY